MKGYFLCSEKECFFLIQGAKIMHETAKQNAIRFFNAYVRKTFSGKLIDIGSRLVSDNPQGFTIRHLCPPNIQYIGIDLEPGFNVDLVLQKPNEFPIEDNSVDYVVSSSCFEHSQFFWVTYLEILRILKPNGLLYMCAPSNGPWHRHPIDGWRFYPDCGKALEAWGKHNQFDNCLLEQYTSFALNDVWEDYVMITLKDQRFIADFPNRIIDNFPHFKNGSKHPHTVFCNFDNGWEFWGASYSKMKKSV